MKLATTIQFEHVDMSAHAAEDIWFGTAGAQPKCWSASGDMLLKQDLNRPAEGMVQWNGLAEELASKALEIMHVPHAEYETCFINGKAGCASKNFVKSDETLLSFSDILTDADLASLMDPDNEDLNGKLSLLCHRLQDRCGIDQQLTKDWILTCIRVDMVLMSGDRHYGNLSVIQSHNGAIRFAPIYDNGACLLAEQALREVDGYQERKLILPYGPQMFGFFPVKEYLKLLAQNTGFGEIYVDADAMEEMITQYANPYYESPDVERAKWLLWDNVDFYLEMDVLHEEDHSS